MITPPLLDLKRKKRAIWSVKCEDLQRPDGGGIACGSGSSLQFSQSFRDKDVFLPKNATVRSEMHGEQWHGVLLVGGGGCSGLTGTRPPTSQVPCVAQVVGVQGGQWANKGVGVR